MTWQPTASAWNTFSNSRGLAQISSAFGRPRSSSTERVMTGTGSTPVSAIRPANKDTNDATVGESTFAISATCDSVRMAVTFNCTPAFASRDTSGAAGSPRVFVMGILTNTLSPHDAISSACASISANSSENTSNEMGRSGTMRSTSRENAT